MGCELRVGDGKLSIKERGCLIKRVESANDRCESLP